MDAQDMILDDVTRKQLIWYGHVEKIDPTRLPKIICRLTVLKLIYIVYKDSVFTS